VTNSARARSFFSRDCRSWLPSMKNIRRSHQPAEPVWFTSIGTVRPPPGCHSWSGGGQVPLLEVRQPAGAVRRVRPAGDVRGLLVRGMPPRRSVRVVPFTMNGYG
jgi:hypothetical protein